MAAAGPLLRVLDILGEMLAGVREKKSELNQRIADVYLLVFCRVSEAKINADAAALAEALRMLEFERADLADVMREVRWRIKLGTAGAALAVVRFK